LEHGWWKKDMPSNRSVKVSVRIAQVLKMELGELLPPTSSVESDEDEK